jgi:DivIVA domain-containing protein
MSPRFWQQSTASKPTPVIDGAQLRTAGSTLTRTKFREGYDIDQVDAFLGRALIAVGEHRRAASLSLTPEAVLTAKFQATEFREGYDRDEVDDLLDQVVASLRA